MAALCYATVILSPLPSIFLSRYGDRVHYCGACGAEIAKWRSEDGGDHDQKIVASLGILILQLQLWEWEDIFLGIVIQVCDCPRILSPNADYFLSMCSPVPKSISGYS